METPESQPTPIAPAESHSVVPAISNSESINSGDIQQASWQASVPQVSSSSQGQGVMAQQPLATHTRDDAPSPMIVVGCLIGFGLLSMALFLQSVPHYWFHRHQFKDRLRGR